MERVSTAQVVQTRIDQIHEHQAAIARLQRTVATGVGLEKPSDDPGAAGEAERTRATIARGEVEGRMLNFARTRMQYAEGAIGDGMELYQSARELLLSANNDTNGPPERAIFAQQLRSMRDELARLANRGDGLGGYVFGGAGTREEPFSTGPDGFRFRADPGQQLSGTGLRFALTLDGGKLFEAVPGPSGSRSIFAALDDTIAALEYDGLPSDELHARINAGIDALDVTHGRLETARARIGEQLAGAERLEQSLAMQEEGARARLSELVDADLAEAISALNQHQTGLDAALRTYAQLSGLSLFNYIR